MSLTVKLKNIGILKQAEFSLGDLTIICGENNTGKTYAAYALYGFLRSWHDLIRIPISDHQVHTLLTDGYLNIELTQYVKKADQILAEACKRYSEKLYSVFAAPKDYFSNCEFHIEPSTIHIPKRGVLDRIISQNEQFLISSRKERNGELIFTLTIGGQEGKKIDPILVKDRMNSIINRVVFSKCFPRNLILSVERTGVTVFQKELDSARNRLLDEMIGGDKNDDPRELLLKSYKKYPWPVRDNIDFTRQLEDIEKNKSFISKEHPEILDDFIDIVGGTYAVTQNDMLYYFPKGTRRRLTMDLSSSSARALLDLSFYLNCIAEKGDLLMVDEPELSLHPENQRRIARLFARLTNLGIKVFITTHSDYIIKELNTLIMLNHDKPHLKRVAEENSYQESELIKAEQIKVYVAEEALIPLEEGQKRRRRGHTLVPAKVHPRFGIGVHSFDKTIDDMNRIQDDIVWGEE